MRLPPANQPVIAFLGGKFERGGIRARIHAALAVHLPGAVSVEHRFAAQHKHPQPLYRGFQQIRRHHQQETVGTAQHQHIGQHPPARRIVGGETSLARLQIQNVVGKLAVQKFGGIRATYLRHAEKGQFAKCVHGFLLCFSK